MQCFALHKKEGKVQAAEYAGSVRRDKESATPLATPGRCCTTSGSKTDSPMSRANYLAMRFMGSLEVFNAEKIVSAPTLSLRSVK